MAPLAIHFDASEVIPTSVTPQPFYEVVYKWDFGDPKSGYFKYGNKESKNWAVGAVAAHVFEPRDWKNSAEEHRTYTVRLWMRLPDDAATEIEQTQQITVYNPYWHYPGSQTVAISNQGNFMGADPSWLWITANGPGDWAVVRQYLRTSTAQRPVRVLLQQGENWVVDRLHNFDAGNVGGTLGVFGLGYTAALLRVPGYGDEDGEGSFFWVAAVEDDSLDFDPEQWVELRRR